MDTREIKAPAGMSDMLPKDHDYFTYLKGNQTPRTSGWFSKNLDSNVREN